MINKAASLFIVLFSAGALAAPWSSTARLETSNSSATASAGLWLFGSVLGGTLDNVANEPSINTDQYAAKAVGSFYSVNAVNDIGLGAVRFHNNAADLNTDAVLLDLQSSYRLTDTWHAGPLLSTTWGKARDLGASDDTVTAFLGAGVFKHWAISRTTLARVGFKAMGDLNIPSQTVTNAALELQIGGSPVPTRSISTVAEEPSEQIASLPSDSEYVVSQRVFFDLEKSDINQDQNSTLGRIAEKMKKNPEAIGHIEVRGYADPSGSEAYNLALSADRAEQVKQSLSQHGIPMQKMETRAFGESVPVKVGGVVGMRESRRAEIVLQDVKDQKFAQEVMDQ